MKLVIDVNIWISFGIGKRLSYLSDILEKATIQVYSCEELYRELGEVSKRSKLKKYLSTQRVSEVIELLNATTEMVELTVSVTSSPDPKDNYLFALCKTVDADFLVTGDKLLIEVGNFERTRIIPFSDLGALLETY